MLTIKKVGFIGTGIMGAPIAGHLMQAGYQLIVHTRTRKKAEKLLDEGAQWAETPSEVAQHADVIFTMLGYPEEVEDVYLATDGLVRTAKKGAYLIDLTTSSPQLARDIHDVCAIEDIVAFDCPVTGGQQGAIDGTLTLIAGAREETVRPVLPLLKSFSSQIFYFGAAGKGQTAKLCNQVSLASCMVGYADAIALAEQGGVDVDEMLNMVSQGMGSSQALKQLASVSRAGDYKPRFMSEHMRKDLGLALQTSEELDITLPGCETAYTLYDMLCEVGGSRMGTQALTLLYADQVTGEEAGLDWSRLNQDGDDEECCCHHEGDQACSCDDGHCHEHHGDACSCEEHTDECCHHHK